jgi:hypothetical protein
MRAGSGNRACVFGVIVTRLARVDRRADARSFFAVTRRALPVVLGSDARLSPCLDHLRVKEGESDER